MSGIPPTPLIEIRNFAVSDTLKVAQIWRESWTSTGLARPEDPTLHGYLDRLEKEEHWSIRLASLHGEVVGFVAFQRDQNWLRQLFVEPSSQRTGVGSALLNATKLAMPGGFWLRTDLENWPARRFYELRGLRLSSQGPHPVSGELVAVYVWP